MGEAIRSLLKMTSSRHRPWQLAMAIALGICCGLMPKANLSFLLLAGICYLLPIHLMLATLICLGTSLFAPLAEATFGQLGLWSLTHPQLRGFWLRLDAFPLVPWLAFHNSVVHGSLLCAATLLLPLYVVLLPVANWLAPARQRRALSASNLNLNSLGDLYLSGIETSLPQDAANDAEQDLPEVSQAEILRPLGDTALDRQRQAAAESSTASVHPDEFVCERTDDIPPVANKLKAMLTDCQDESNTANSDEIIARGANMADFVDQLLSECVDDWDASQLAALGLAETGEIEFSDRASPENQTTNETDVESRVDRASATAVPAAPPNDEEWAAGEPQLEFLRRLDVVDIQEQAPHGAHRGHMQQAPQDAPADTRRQVHASLHHGSTPGNATEVDQSKFDPDSHQPEPLATNSTDNAHQGSEYRDEALRFLLQHLKASNDQA